MCVVCVCVSVCLYGGLLCMHACMHECTRVNNVFVYACMHACMHDVCIRVNNVFVYACMHVCLHVCQYVYM